MPKERKQPSASKMETEAEAVGRLTNAIERVEQELRVLRDVIDEAREEFAWAVRNDRFRSPPHIVHVTKMPLKIGRGRTAQAEKQLPKTPPAEQESPANSPKPGKRDTLWDAADE